MGELGRGYVYEKHAFYLQVYSAGVRKSIRLADKDREHYSATCKTVKALRDRR